MDEPAHCCEQLRAQVEYVCERHGPHGACVDQVVGYAPRFDEYGLWIHNSDDGAATSWLSIRHCPFCGAHLPQSRRDEWFDRLESIGVEPEDAPLEMLNYGWWRRAGGSA